MRQTRMGMGLLALVTLLASGHRAGADVGPFVTFTLPDPWEARFWADPGAKSLLTLDAKALAALVPTQAGIKHCRCPKCDAPESSDPLAWSAARPEKLVCRRCGVVLPNDQLPAKVDAKPPEGPAPGGTPPAKVEKKLLEEVVEVLPRTFHHYPYHAVEPEKQLYPEERLYLSAKRDHEAREFLARAALYAAVKHREAADPRLARVACVLLLRFAQVYPAYATHHDQPGTPKFFDRADLAPPYRRGYGTAKWDWSGCLDVPLNLVIAYALVRDDPAMAEAGRALGDAHPNRTIERDLLRASAEFCRRQPEEYAETSIYAYRGMLAVGRLLDDPELVREAASRLDGFLSRCFYHDGLWRWGDAASHRRVVAQIDGWIDRLLKGYTDPPGFTPADGSRRFEDLAGAVALPMVALARSASGASWLAPSAATPEILLASWPTPPPAAETRRPALLGGAGIARLGVGRGEDALDLELRGLGDYGGRPSGRLALRLAVGGRGVLGDLEADDPSPWGFDRATASRNGLVLVDGLNQRETINDLRDPAPGADVLFFAADPDFQVARMEDRHAYPHSAKIYRHTVVAAAGARTRYAVSLFEVDGGLQHDQILHAATAMGGASWRLSTPEVRGPDSLLPPGMTFLPSAKADDGRWFVQAMGAFHDLTQARLDRPAQALLHEPGGAGVRVHLLNQVPATALIGRSQGGSAEGRASLILRRRSEDGAAISTEFVTVYEPVGVSAPLRRVGRVSAAPGVVAIALETAEGVEYLVLNREPGKACEAALPDGRTLRTDGVAVRVTAAGPILAGGTFAEVGARRVALERLTGAVVASNRVDRGAARGQFRVSDAIPDPERVAGRMLLIRHGDGSSRGWTIVSAENLSGGGALFSVREDVGLRIDPGTDAARYERFPGTLVPGPHRFGVSRIAR